MITFLLASFIFTMTYVVPVPLDVLKAATNIAISRFALCNRRKRAMRITYSDARSTRVFKNTRKRRKPKAVVVVDSREYLPKALAIAAALARGELAACKKKKHSVTLNLPREINPDMRVVFRKGEEQNKTFQVMDDIHVVMTGKYRPRLGCLVKRARSEGITGVKSIMRDTIDDRVDAIGSARVEEKIAYFDWGAQLSKAAALFGAHSPFERPSSDVAMEWMMGDGTPDLILNACVGPGHGACARWQEMVMHGVNDGDEWCVERGDDADVDALVEDLESDETIDIVLRVRAGTDLERMLDRVDRFVTSGTVFAQEGAQAVDVMWGVGKVKGKKRHCMKIFQRFPDGTQRTGVAFRLLDEDSVGSWIASLNHQNVYDAASLVMAPHPLCRGK